MNAAYQPRSLVLSLAIASYALLFTTFVVFEVPGLGIAHLFYLPVAALALTGGVKRGILAGAIAVAVFTLDVVINPNISPSELLTLSTPLRFLTYATMGGLLGWFSSRDRELVERLRVLAERDFLTGLPNTRAFEAAIARRFEAGLPFALLLGDMDGLKTINDSQGHAEGNDALRRLALMLGSSLRPEDEVARVGGDEFAVLTSDGPMKPRRSLRSSRALWRARRAGSRSAGRSIRRTARMRSPSTERPTSASTHGSSYAASTPHALCTPSAPRSYRAPQGA